MDKKKKCIIDEYKTVYGFSLFVIINPDKSVIDDEWASYTAYTTRGAFDKESNEDCEVIVINSLKGDNSDVNTFIGYLTECVTQTANKE